MEGKLAKLVTRWLPSHRQAAIGQAPRASGTVAAATRRIPYAQASAITRDNAESRVPPRGQDGNRLEPECWPALRPSFRFDRDTGVFVIGSCFASNIERYLREKGYRLNSILPAIDPPLPNSVLNKYTPASIYQEVAWARAIYDRDDTFRPADAARFLFRLSDGRVVDTQLHASQPCPEETAVAHREAIYRTYRTLFTSKVVVITLGLIEAWYDQVAEHYICETPSKWLLREQGRFLFEQLDFATCLDFVRRTFALIFRDGNRPNVLLTTSPVVLTRTFTQDDVIVANMYSKSVLRAVAGQISKEFENIDYFPSFENVILTRKNAVWHDDMIHVSESFIRQIMMRVESQYTDNLDFESARDADEAARVVGLVHSHAFDEAAEAYGLIADPFSKLPPEFHSAAAVLHMRRGDADLARRHNAADMREAGGIPDRLLPLRITVAEWLDGPQAGRDMMRRLGARLSANPLCKAAEWLAAEGRLEDSAFLLKLIPEQSSMRDNLRNRITTLLRNAGEQELADRFASLRN